MELLERRRKRSIALWANRHNWPHRRVIRERGNPSRVEQARKNGEPVNIADLEPNKRRLIEALLHGAKQANLRAARECLPLSLTEDGWPYGVPYALHSSPRRPSLDSDDAREVWAAYQKELNMKEGAA